MAGLAFFKVIVFTIGNVLEDNQDNSHTSSSSFSLPRAGIIFCIVAWSRIWKWEKLKLHIILKKNFILSYRWDYLSPATEMFYHWACYLIVTISPLDCPPHPHIPPPGQPLPLPWFDPHALAMSQAYHHSLPPSHDERNNSKRWKKLYY